MEQSQQPQSEGLLTAWLRRNANAQKTEKSSVPEAPATPTWSDASDDDTNAAVVSPPSMSNVGSTASIKGAAERSTSPVPQERSEKTSWLTRISGAYTTAVRGGQKALQKLTTRDRLRDSTEAAERLERTAAEIEGEARVITIKRWAALLKDLSAHPQKPINLASGGTAYAGGTAPSGATLQSGSTDWQQLQASRTSISGSSSQQAPTQQGDSASVPPIRTSAAVQPMSDATSEGLQNPSSSLNLKASEVLYVDWSLPMGQSEPITFRELFLRSNALQLLTAGYAVYPPTDTPQEREALLSLLSTCLHGDAALHSSLADLLLRASHSLSGCRRAGTHKQHCQSISDAMVQAVASLKLKAEVEVADRRMALLTQDLNAQAAAAAQAHKFNSGTVEPSGDCTPNKLASGVAATAEVMLMAERLCQLGQQRRALVLVEASPPFPALLSSLLEAAQQRLQELEASMKLAEAKTAETQHQQKEGGASRVRKLLEMDTELRQVALEVADLDTKKAALLAQLAQVDAQLAQTHARKADLEEGRNVYEEGISLTLDALQHELDNLSSNQQQDSAESAALEASSRLLGAASAGHATWRAHDESAAVKVAAESAREYGHAATRHLYFQRAQAQLLMRQLRFCSGELQGSASKQEHMSQMGMGRLLADVVAQRTRLLQQYIDAESAALSLFQDITLVQKALYAADASILPGDGTVLPTQQEGTAGGVSSSAEAASAQHQAVSAVLSEELQGVLASIEAIREAFNGRERPQGLPAPGQPLPLQTLQEARGDASSARTSEDRQAAAGGTAVHAQSAAERAASSSGSLPPELGGVATPQAEHSIPSLLRRLQTVCKSPHRRVPLLGFSAPASSVLASEWSDCARQGKIQKFSASILGEKIPVQICARPDAMLGPLYRTDRLLIKFRYNQEPVVFLVLFDSIDLLTSFYGFHHKYTKAFGLWSEVNPGMPSTKQLSAVIKQVGRDIMNVVDGMVDLYGQDLLYRASFYYQAGLHVREEVEDYNTLINRLAATALMQTNFQPVLPPDFQPSGPEAWHFDG
ncbi:hypothetical protein WJX73_010321 [Symbiochloris irregularis]|uniref:Uncharacterized protein n=1 Tax=Symbiochloris irregularis TaxID=706552 RepID=A0AAW1NWY9_9CHLO